MQKLFNIKSSISSYEVNIGIDFRSFLKNIDCEYVLIVDKSLVDSYNIRDISQKIVLIDANEESKDFIAISKVISEVKSYSLKKSDLLIAVGGGVIQDITCFVASIYMRGVDWIYIPTTFLGICDSCIGGKSSINVGSIKNLVGNFYPPKKILIDFCFVESLNEEQMDSGICEAIKICYAYEEDGNKFSDFLKLFNQGDYKNQLIDITCLTLETKKWFIEVDEFDKKERKLLNFGHTFGHAIESAVSYKIPHGIAVGFGILWAIFMSYEGEINNDRVNNLKRCISSILKKHQNLCDLLQNVSSEDVLNGFIYDKKHSKDNYICILIDNSGYLYQGSISKNGDFDKKFNNSLKRLKGHISKIIKD